MKARQRLGMALTRALWLVTACAFGCSNVLESSARKTTDDAYYEDATKAVNNSRWDDAIVAFEKLSANYINQPKIRMHYAGALAGKCGLNFIEFVQALKGSSASIFKFAMNAWTGKTISPAHCLLAEKQIRQIWTTNTASADQKFFMAIIGLAKMGAYLRNKADVDGVGNLGDGTADTAFNACSATVGGANNLEDDEIGQIMTGLMLFVTNVADFAADVGSGSADTASITTMCAQIVALGQPNPCAYTDWDTVPANEKANLITVFRTLLTTGPSSLEQPNDPEQDPGQRLGITSPYQAANGALGYELDGSCSRNPFLTCCQ